MSTSVLYLTNTRHGQQAWKNPSARHRCYHYADALFAAGVRCSVLHIDEMRPQLAATFSHIIFHRPVDDHRFRRALRACSAGNAVLHADYDDLLFEPQLANASPKYLNGNANVSAIADEFEINRRALRCFDSFIVSTTFLANRIKAIVPQSTICVLPNSMPRQFILPEKQVTPANLVTIGYFPGSSSHGHDFASIKEPLAQTLSDYPQCRVLIAGQFRAQDCAGLPRVTLLPFVDYNRYLYLLRQVDLSIAPLVDNVFNQAKSAVKLIESVSVGTPILASPNGDMHAHSDSLATFSASTQQWKLALQQRIDDASRRTDSTKTVCSRFGVSHRLPILTEHLGIAANTVEEIYPCAA